MKRILLLGASVLVSSGWSHAADAVKITPPQSKVLSSQEANQRYVFGQISEYRRDQYLLDTKTGRLWQKVCAKSGDKGSGDDNCLAVLQVVPYVTLDDRLGITPE
jgi:hypothetical protein